MSGPDRGVARHVARPRRGFRIGTGAAHRIIKGRLELGGHGIRYHLKRFRGIALHSAALHVARSAID
jgi:hypothetical protein